LFSSLDPTEKVPIEMMSLLSRSFVLLIIFAASGTEAFAPERQVQRNVSISHYRTLCFLHPSQAQDLEACAYDLMKAAVENEARQQEQAMKNSLSQDSLKKVSMETGGPVHWPVSWARKKLWPSKDAGAGTGWKLP
jgi:hypothetical protein